MAGTRPASRLNKTRNNKLPAKKSAGSSSKEDSSLPDTQSNVDNKDEALLKKPMETSVVGLIRALKVLESGTTEVRDYLSNECDIIYECRVCRSLFRSLSNFILHKRLYCQEPYENTFKNFYQRKFNDDENLYIQSENNLRTDDDNEEQGNENKPKDLSSIVERLGRKVNKSYQINNMKLSDLPIINEDVELKNVLSLQNVDSTSSAMFQTLSDNTVKNSTEFIGNEVMELHMMENGAAVIGPDGRCLGFRDPNLLKNNESNTKSSYSVTNVTSKTDKIECEKCNQKFSTRKTLRFHINTKHNENRLVYPCPDCSETFVNPWGVYRHLFKAHRRSAPEVRKLRRVVQNSSFQMDQAPLGNRKVRSTNMTDTASANSDVPMTEQERLVENNKEWMANLESDNDLQCCGGCGRRFERKAALHSHSLMCQKRIAACNKLKKGVLSQNDEKSEKSKNSKPVVKKNTISKKKSNDEANMNSDISSNIDESRPSSVAENLDNALVDTECQSRKMNHDNDGMKLVLSDDDDSLEEVPVKDPLGVSDSEDTSSVTVPVSQESTTQEAIVFNSEITKTVSVLSSTANESKISDKEQENKLLTATISLQSQSFINDMLAIRMKAFTNVGKRFVCMPCDYRYSSLPSLRRHMAIHFNWKRFRCLCCDFMSFDKRESILHAQTVHHATLDAIKKFVARMTENESDLYSSKIFLPLNTTPQEIITLDDSDEESKIDKENSSDNSTTNEQSTSNEVSRNLIMEMIIGNSDQKVNISSNTVEKEDDSKTSPPFTPTSGFNNIRVANFALLEDSPPTSAKTAQTASSIATSRPVRNRVKPVNKDFIYDMSAITREDYDDYGSKSKRKSESLEMELKNTNMQDADFNLKKKKRRNSKVYTNCSNSNSSYEANDTNLRIVPIDFNHSSPAAISQCLNSFDSGTDDLIQPKTENDVDSNDQQPEFVIHSVMSSVDM